MKKQKRKIAFIVVIAMFMSLITPITSKKVHAAADDIAITATAFPDTTFRTYVTEQFDTNKDGYLSADEISKVTSIDLSRKWIKKLTGIEYFTSLTELNGNYNSFSALSNLPDSLKKLSLYSCNNLHTLSVPNGLEELNIDYCNFTDLPELPDQLSSLSCNYNDITGLSKVPSGLVSLECSFNQIEGVVDVSNSTGMKTLIADNNKITSVKLCSSAIYEKIDVSYNLIDDEASITGKTISWDNNNFIYRPQGTIDLTGKVQIDMEQTTWSYTGSEVKPVLLVLYQKKYLTVGTDYTVSYSNNVESGTATATAAFKGKYAGTASINFEIVKEIIIDEDTFPDSNFRKYIKDHFDDDGNSRISGNEIKDISYIDIRGCSIRDLTGIGHFKYLENLACSDNQLTSLSELPDSLKIVECSDNKITDLSKKLPASLTMLICQNNLLTQLPVLPDSLTYLNCMNNKIAGTLDLSQNKNLKDVVAAGNELKEVILCENATYSSIDLSFNYMKSTDDVKGQRILWDSDNGFIFSYQYSFSDFITVKLAKSVYEYTGKPIEPAVIVTYKEETLTRDKDYTVEYLYNTEVGTGLAVVTFIGDYVEVPERIDSFQIIGKTVVDYTLPKAPDYVTAKLSAATSVKVSWKNCAGADGYHVYYKNATSKSYVFYKATVGTAINVSGLTKGKAYQFKVVPYVMIDGAKVEGITSKVSSKIYTLNKVTLSSVKKKGSKVKVSWKNIQGETGYQISCSTSKKKTKIVSTYKTTSGTNKLVAAKKGKTYYYKVRAYRVVDGKKIYGAWSNIKAFKRR